MAKSRPEEWRYLCRFHPCHEILMPLHEILEMGKKQDLTPFKKQDLTPFTPFTIIIKTSGQRVDILHEFC